MSLNNKKLLISIFCIFTLISICYISFYLQNVTESKFDPDRKKTKFLYRKKALLTSSGLTPLEKHIFQSAGSRELNISDELSYLEEVKGKYLKLGKAERSDNHFTKPTNSKSVIEYLIKTNDPRSGRLLKKLFSTINDDVYQNFFTIIKKYEDKYHVSFKQLPFQQQWKILIPTMKDLGYEQKLPTVINIGSKKSGTNAFGFFFQQHPQVCHSLGNEVHYFDWNHEKGTGYYKSRMGFATKDQISFEKTPRYFVTEKAPLYIHEELPKDVKFVICVRDPVQRAISDFRHESELAERRNHGGRIDRTKYDTKNGLSQGLKFEKLVLTPNGEVNASNEIIRTSLYQKHLENWLQYFPLERFLIINHDDLQDNALNELKRAEQFAGLKPYFHKDMFYYDDSRHGSCMKGKPRPCPAKSTPGFLPKSQLSPQLSKKLYDFYRPYNNGFAKLIGKRFDWMDR